MPVTHDVNLILDHLSRLDFGRINVQLAAHPPTDVRPTSTSRNLIPTAFRFWSGLLNNKLRPHLRSYLSRGVDLAILAPTGKVGCLVEAIRTQVAAGFPVDGESGMVEFMSTGLSQAVNAFIWDDADRNNEIEGHRRLRVKGTGGSGKPDLELLINHTRSSVFFEVKPPIVASTRALEDLCRVVQHGATKIDRNGKIKVVAEIMQAVEGHQHGDWNTIGRLLTQVREEFASGHPNVCWDCLTNHEASVLFWLDRAAGKIETSSVIYRDVPRSDTAGVSIPGTFALFLALAVLPQEDYNCTGGPENTAVAAAAVQVQQAGHTLSTSPILSAIRHPMQTVQTIRRQTRSSSSGTRPQSSSNPHPNFSLNFQDDGCYGSRVNTYGNPLAQMSWDQIHPLSMLDATLLSKQKRRISIKNLYQRFTDSNSPRQNGNFVLDIECMINQSHVWDTFRAAATIDAISTEQRVIVKISHPAEFSKIRIVHGGPAPEDAIQSCVSSEIDALRLLHAKGLADEGVIPHIYGILQGINEDKEAVYIIILEDAGDAVDMEKLTREEAEIIVRHHERIIQTGLAHGDVHPGHWMKHPNTGSIKIIDFDQSSLEDPDILDLDRQHARSYVEDALARQANHGNGYAGAREARENTQAT